MILKAQWVKANSLINNTKETQLKKKKLYTVQKEQTTRHHCYYYVNNYSIKIKKKWKEKS